MMKAGTFPKKGNPPAKIRKIKIITKLIIEMVISRETMEIGTQTIIEMGMLEKIWWVQLTTHLVLSERDRDLSNAINAKDGVTLIGYAHQKEI